MAAMATSPRTSLRPARDLSNPALLVALLLQVAGTASATAEATAEVTETPRRQFLVVASEAVAEPLARRVFQRWVLPSRDDLELKVVPSEDPEGPAAADSTAAIVLARTCPTEAETLDARLARQLAGFPVRFEADQLVLGSTRTRDPRATLALRLSRRDDEGPERWFVCGRTEAATAEATDRVLMQAAQVRWRRGGRDFDYLLLEHRWMERNGQWQWTEEGSLGFDPEEVDRFAERSADRESRTTTEHDPIVLRTPPGLADDSLPAQRARGLAIEVRSLAQALELDTQSLDPIEILVEEDHVRQGRFLADIGPAVLTNAGTIHPVVEGFRSGEDLFHVHHSLARLLLRRAGFELPPALEDGAALALSRDWYGRPAEAWIPPLVTADVGPTADEVLATERPEDGSRVLWPPLVATALESLPGETFRQRLQEALDPATLGRALSALGDRPDGTQPRPEDRARERRPAFQNGISFAMANGLEVGYHAPAVDRQLEHLTDLGANAVSLMPFAYQEYPDQPELRFLNQNPVSETDVGLVHAARRARARGFTVLWKPHLWISHDSWPGDVAMTTPEDWQRWFQIYRRYIVHHAVLAQHCDAELFSIGVELGRTVEREAEWRKLIAAVRGVYDGRLTYSGNWWADYDRATFWDALDTVGVDAYFPLADTAEADRATLVAGARRARDELARAAERFGKPILLTEVGFSARHGAWVSPHEEGGELSEAHQALAYEVLFETLGHPDWLAGVYLWKVFSHPDAENGGQPDFRFLARTAEPVVARYFEHRRSPAPRLAAE